MTDKEKIKEEIERRFDDNMKASEQYTEDSKSRALFTSAAKEDYDLLAFIDSLPEEHNEDLEEEINRVDDWYPVELKYIQEIAHHFVEWQKQKDYNAYSHVPLKDIHDAWQTLKKNKPDIESYPAVCFQKGADWKENQMKEALQTEYEKVGLICSKK